ncbi:YbeD family protein [Thiopseudomonas denitrificans]|uniref:UPF0250 protein DFQ45_11144 n=1 Tax=Thiopseudomonas denitrificans TaxID=1501432 RepID=A0A4R6TWM8_9GAMM|nr:DUF493 domain-containing protein [Thiopseudomonas denitrificans]TDQ36663.1 hypothetical protein DFQ45_11144 [Thiopseudomonas denitrificans]
MQVNITDLGATAEEQPKIEFPCEQYPVKIIGDHGDDYVQTVLDVVCAHAPEFDPATADQQLSSNGRFCSVRVRITAHSEEHLSGLNEALRQTGKVRMVL